MATSIISFRIFPGSTERSEYLDFNRRQVEMEISAPLITTFTGAQPVPSEPEKETSTIYGTQIADTSRCFLLRGWHPAQKIIRLEYPGGAVNVGIDSTDETKLLEALKYAGIRTV